MGDAGDDTIAVDYVHAGSEYVYVYGGPGDDDLSVGGDADYARIDGCDGDDTCTFQGSAIADADCYIYRSQSSIDYDYGNYCDAREYSDYDYNECNRRLERQVTSRACAAPPGRRPSSRASRRTGACGRARP